jgi:hypothetical protein
MMPSTFGGPMRTPGTEGVVSPGFTSTFSSVMVKFRRVSTKSPARAACATNSEPNIHVEIRIRRMIPPVGLSNQFLVFTQGATVMSLSCRGCSVQKLNAFL